MIALLLVALAMTGDASLPPFARSQAESERSGGRISFRIVTVEEEGVARNIISEATIEGPPGTDFNINLQGERFRMTAGFLTDFLRRDGLRIRARLNTRRLYGHSERDLPLYEEDEQRHSLELGFNEQLVLLPFGQGGEPRLKIEITPSLSEQSAHRASGATRPLEINIQRQSPGGALSIQAFKRPHRYMVEATLLESGREVARGAQEFLLAEAGEMSLQPTAQASAEVTGNPLIVRLTVNEFTRSRPADLTAISFDLSRRNVEAGGERETLAANWAGISALGAAMSYDLSRTYLPGSGQAYELRFRITLAPGEVAD